MRYKLGDICFINKRSYSTKDNYKFVNYLDTGNITKNSISQIQYIDLSLDKLPSRAKRMVQRGDIIYSTVRPNQEHYGFIKEMPDNFLVSTGFTVLTPNREKVDPYWLYCYLTQKTITDQMQMIAEQNVSTYPSIRPENLAEIELELPDLETQKKIAHILFVLEEKIELNSLIINNLDNAMQAIYNDWFRDFSRFSGFDYKESELGDIPACCNVADIYSVANVIYGAPFKSKLFNDQKNGRPVVRIRDLKKQEIKTYTPELHSKGYLLRRGDIVVGMDGEFRPYIWGNSEAWLNQRVCVFDNKRPYGKAFVYYSIKPLLNFVERTEVATTVIHIGKKDFDDFKIILPDNKILDEFDSITYPMFERIVYCMLENRTLENIRDFVLPKLISGEINLNGLTVND